MLVDFAAIIHIIHLNRINHLLNRILNTLYLLPRSQIPRLHSQRLTLSYQSVQQGRRVRGGNGTFSETRQLSGDLVNDLVIYFEEQFALLNGSSLVVCSGILLLGDLESLLLHLILLLVLFGLLLLILGGRILSQPVSVPLVREHGPLGHIVQDAVVAAIVVSEVLANGPNSGVIQPRHLRDQLHLAIKY